MKSSKISPRFCVILGIVLTLSTTIVLTPVLSAGVGLASAGSQDPAAASPAEAEGADCFQFPIPGYTSPDPGSYQDFGTWRPDIARYHLGEDDTHVEVGDPVHATGKGEVKYSTTMDGFGGIVIIDHFLPDGSHVCSIVGHLKPDSLHSVGPIERDDTVGHIADTSENGGFVPHVHFGIRRGPCPVPLGGPWGLSSDATELDNWLDPTGFVRERACIAVTPPGYDNIGAILTQMGYSWTQIADTDLNNYDNISQYGLIFANCSSTAHSNGANAAISLQQFVSKGGSLYASDWAYTYIQAAFPTFVGFAGEPRVGTSQIVTADIEDPGLANYLDPVSPPATIDLDYDLSQWAVIDSVSSGTRVHLRGSFEVYDANTLSTPLRDVENQLLAPAAWQYDKPLLVSFNPNGDTGGKVVFTTFHNETQLSEIQQKLLEYLILIPRATQAEQQIKQVMDSEDVLLVRTDLNIIDPGQTSPLVSYGTEATSEMVFALAWGGSTLRLSLFRPGGALYSEVERSLSPISIVISNAEGGTWRYRVTGVDVPYENYPYSVGIGKTAYRLHMPVILRSFLNKDRIAFVSERDGNKEIYVMNADGSGFNRLTYNSADDRWPSWSADGAQIAFMSNRSGNWEIYVMNADGSGQRNLTNTPAQDLSPCWSPDGQRIAFYSDRNGSDDIYVMNVDGGGQMSLTNRPGDERDPSWSPDSQRIAFRANRDDGDVEIYVMNSDGTDQQNLTNNLGDDWYPSWSPDGQHIAFTSKRDGQKEIYLMNIDGSAQINLTKHPGEDWWPSWSPDGQRISFTSNRGGNDDVWVMSGNGNNQTILVSHPSKDHSAAWAPR